MRELLSLTTRSLLTASSADFFLFLFFSPFFSILAWTQPESRLHTRHTTQGSFLFLFSFFSFLFLHLGPLGICSEGWKICPFSALFRHLLRVCVGRLLFLPFSFVRLFAESGPAVITRRRERLSACMDSITVSSDFVAIAGLSGQSWLDPHTDSGKFQARPPSRPCERLSRSAASTVEARKRKACVSLTADSVSLE